MMAYLRFRLPAEKDEYNSAMDGWKYRAVLDEITQWVREQRKWREMSPEQAEVYEEVWQKLWEIRQDRGVADE